ncbi:MAG: AAA family ATPase [bacterium]
MKLIIIYGPPAAGKLTVAQELARITGYRLFHNHLTIELAKEIFPERNQQSADLISQLRLDVFDAAAKAGTDLIFTMVYAAGLDDEYFSRVVEIIESSGGEVCFVQLLPSEKVLESRISAQSRAAYSKIRDVEVLRNLTATRDLLTPVSHDLNLSIDNSERSPQDVAEQISRHFSL